MVTETDRLVAATLAAAKAASEKRETERDYVLEYERMLRIILRRKDRFNTTAEGSEPSTSATSAKKSLDVPREEMLNEDNFITGDEI